MKTKIKVEKEFDLKIIILHAGVRYWEDAIINGTRDTENGDNIPCKVGDSWKPIIDIDSGVINNWKQGVKAVLNYKVCDCLGFDVLDANGEIVLQAEDGYVPSTLSPKENGYGDYIKMEIDENGKIADWAFDVNDFIDED